MDRAASSASSTSSAREDAEAGYRRVGHHLDSVEDSAVLLDWTSSCSHPVIVGATAGFQRLTGYSVHDSLGLTIQTLLEDRTPIEVVSKSGLKNLDSFYNACLLDKVERVAETFAVNPAIRRDGSHFFRMSYVGICDRRESIGEHRYVLMVQHHMADCLMPKITPQFMKQSAEEAHQIYRRLDTYLKAQCEKGVVPIPLGTERSSGSSFSFFSKRLQDHSVLSNKGCTAARREADQLPRNSILFGAQAMRMTTKGLEFSLRVDELTPAFAGYPVLGFTRRKPVDEPDIFPTLSSCLGASQLIGGVGECTVRDQMSHFEVGFKRAPVDQIQVWTMDPPEVPMHKRRGLPSLFVGDILKVTLSHEGQMTLKRNGTTILDFNTERPLDTSCEYYAVVDVCFNVSKVTLEQTAEVHAKLPGGHRKIVKSIPSARETLEHFSYASSDCSGVDTNCSDVEPVVEDVASSSASQVTPDTSEAVSESSGTTPLVPHQVAKTRNMKTPGSAAMWTLGACALLAAVTAGTLSRRQK